jgi:hypothetical protein
MREVIRHFVNFVIGVDEVIVEESDEGGCSNAGGYFREGLAKADALTAQEGHERHVVALFTTSS